MGIKEILREELDNSVRMKDRYEKELSNLPRGSLVKRNIKGHVYYYLIFREDGKFKSIYKGKASREEISKYQEAKKLRAKYRSQLSQVKKQIRYLKGALRGKEAI
jgi:hypothetical protein